MLIYRPLAVSVATVPLLHRLKESVRAPAASGALHQHTIELLIEFGSFESAVADACCPSVDAPLPVLTELRAISTLLGDAACASWLGAPAPARAALAHAAARLSGLTCETLPAELSLTVPEGFAFYALFPERYLAAGREVARRHPASHILVLGLRSIGTTLSAAVAGALRGAGCRVSSWTVRPRGHPFERTLALAEPLMEWFRALQADLVVIADEGPGLSGSSFIGAADAVERLGFRPDQIVLLPAWRSDGSRLRSARARAAWSRYEQIVVEWDAFSAHAGARDTIELSAGRWRTLPELAPGRAVPVQPEHERRKYLSLSSRRLYKFSGLGLLGRRRLQLAEQLAAAGFGPRAFGIEAGYLVTEFVGGTPAGGAAPDTRSLARIAEYFAFRGRETRADQGTPPGQLEEMVLANTGEGLGEEWADCARRIVGNESLGTAVPVHCDGRLQSHEWIATDAGLLKVDALDHGDDHFFPGPTDIAWDLAGMIEEWALTADAADFLLEEFRRRSARSDRAARLEPFRVAYLASRLGYATMAMESLAGTPEAPRWRAARRQYAGRLLALLARARDGAAARGIQATRKSESAAEVPSGVRLIIFDADGTLRRTTVPGQPCPYRSGEWELLPGVRHRLAPMSWGSGGYFLGVASNQDRVGHGFLSETEARKFLCELIRAATESDLPDAAVQCCPHRAEERCDCRKPRPGMLRAIMDYYRATPDETLFVGDSATDEQAARVAGARFSWAADFFGW